MAEVGKTERPAPVRRGLPRRPEEQDQLPRDAISGDPGTALSAKAPAPEPSAVGRARRAGLPRTAEPKPPLVTPLAEDAGQLTVAEPGIEAPPVVVTAGPIPIQEPSNEPTTGPRKARGRVAKILLACLAVLVVAAWAVLAARWFVSLDFMKEFMVRYPGETHLPANAPVGFPAWLGWQHFFNAFFIVLIIRTGWQVRTQERPPAMWVRHNKGLLKSKNPPKKISLTLWAHLTVDVLWLINGIVFVSALFATGQWMRVVPTSWEIIPNAISAALQYASLDWPTEDGWVNYNSLQVLAYFITIFIAAPLAAVSGIRMSNAWPDKSTGINRVYPVELARAVHMPVMLYFVLFVITHVALVFATGARRNLNHMYATQDSGSWAGFWIFFASLLVMGAAVVAARPLVLGPIAQLTGKVSRR